MKDFIFLTIEGFTFQPDSESIEPDIENLQVIGFAKGEGPDEAFENLIESNLYLLDTSFDEIFCYELAKDYDKQKKYYHLTNLREKRFKRGKKH